MSVFEMIVLGVAAALAGFGIAIYNRLVNLKHNVSKAWSNIDVLLKQRHDELPKLVATCKEYMKFEQETLDRVISARSRVFQAREAGDVGALGAAEGALRLGLGQLFALAEEYPDLKANQTFQHLQTRISGLENQIADRREFYNESVNRNNISAGYLLLSAALLWAGVQAHSTAFILGSLAVTMVGAAAAWYLANRRFHIIHDTPTARVRSAAQGYVELVGVAELSPGQGLLSFNGLPSCVWFEVVITRRGHAGATPSTWTRISDETFVLRDETGTCIVDPDHAEVHMAHVRRWSNDGCHYRARFLRQGDPLYAIGTLETLCATEGGFDRRADVAHLLREWKRDADGLRRRFDSDCDGRISASEWQQAVAEAQRIIDATHQEHHEQPDLHVMRAPGRGMPYVLSNQDPETLAQRFRHWSWFHAAMFAAALTGAAWLSI